MAARVQIEIEADDIARLDADVIALKYSSGATGAAGQIAAALGIGAGDLRRTLPSRGDLHVAPGRGRIAARHAAFLHVAPVASFTYDDVRQFNVDVLAALAAQLPMTRHVGLLMHGVFFGMDNERSLRAQIDGCAAAIKEGKCPPALERITIANRGIGLKRLRSLLREVLPDGSIEMPQPVRAASRNATAPQIPGGRFDVFLSFKSADAEYAQQVFDFLGSQGLRVFFSRESLPRLGSDEYHRQIDAAIDQARHMVVVTSAHDHAMSRWVQYEWRLFLGEVNADRKAGNLIPVVAGGMDIDELPIALRNREVVRLTPADLPRLLDYLRSDADRYERARPAPPPSALRALSGLLVAADAPVSNASWTEAHRQAGALAIEGHRGWRLPTLDELRLIREAAIVSARPCYWSSEEAGGTEAFYMHFDDGHVGRGPKSFGNGLSAVFVKTADRLESRPAHT